MDDHEGKREGGSDTVIENSSNKSRWGRFANKHLPLGSKSWWPRASRWISLVVGCLGMAVSATSGSFAFWQNSMRAILNQTETESNLMSQLGNIGAMIAFPAGMAYEHYGSQATNAFGGIFSVVTYLALAFGTSSLGASFFASNQWLVCLLWFVNGFAAIFTYFGSMMPNVENFTFEHRGKVVGILDASVSAGPVLLSFVYNLGFTNGYVEAGEEGKQNLSGFFIFLAIAYSVIALALFLFSGRIGRPKSDEKGATKHSKKKHDDIEGLVENEEQPEVATEATPDGNNINTNEQSIEVKARFQENPKPPNKFSEFPYADRPIWQLLKRWNFYFFLIQFGLNANVIITYLSNVSTYLRSYDLAEYNLLFTVLSQSLAAICKFSVGLLSDVIAERGSLPRSVVFLGPYALQTIALSVSIFYGNSFGVMLFTTISVGIGYGTTWCQAPTLIGELFGGKYLASNLGWAMLVVGVLGFPFTLGFSAIYEAAIYQPGEIYCYGQQCFTWSFALLAAASLCSFISALGLFQNMISNAEDRRRATGIDHAVPDNKSEKHQEATDSMKG